MAFEFFFGVFGLISSDSKSRHKSRIDGDWRLFTPLGASLFRDAGQKPHSPAANSKGSSNDPLKPIFSTTGTLATANNSVSDSVFSSASSSSASSIASSGSASTVTSTATLLNNTGKAGTSFGLDPISGKKYEFMDKAAAAAAAAGKDVDDFAKLGGLAGTSATQAEATDDSETVGSTKVRRARAIYCRIVCTCLWLHVLRLLAGLVVEKSYVTLDFYYLGANRIPILIPVLCLAIQVAAVSLIFIRNNDETNWLVPFYSSKDYLIRSRSNFRPKIEDYTRRVNISIVLALVLALMSSVSISAYLIYCAMQSEAMKGSFGGSGSAPGESVISSPTAPTTGGVNPADPSSSADAAANLRFDRMILTILVIYDVLWAIYSTYICFLVAFYFNLICSIMKSRFHGISKIIEDLAESNTTKTTNQARKITTLYLEHNEACELLDESNDFWQYLIFFTYFTYIPAYCYCLYNLFFVDFETWPSFITSVIHTHTGFIILLISFSAAGVSTEAHAPYTSLHTLSLIQLPLDVEVNIATFLHRVRGLTIGYSCYDLFAITNASMSNTAAACASYFLIVADFSRSSVFTLAQMNGSTTAAAGAGAAVANANTVATLTTPTPTTVG